ncbi:MAG: hypothetical protein L0Z50_14000, partial [Verrucomicrobiales bacterium]|nr:hypothetical protein [Verrucomicrobiales bacterium]
MLEHESPNICLVHVQPVQSHQMYHIVHILFYPPWVAMFDRVTFERKEMQERDYSRASSRPRGWHRFGQQFCKCVLVHQHQVQRKELRGGRIELNKSWTLSKQLVVEFAGKFCPRRLIIATDNKVKIECVPRVPMRNDRVPTRQKECEISLLSLFRDGGKDRHMDPKTLERPVMNVIMAGRNESTEKRMGRVRLAEKFGMVL